MNNKLVRNILLIYFFVVSIVLVVQLCYRNNQVQEPVSENIPLSENLNDTVVLYNDSPVMLVNTRQSVVDSSNTAIVPMIKDECFYVPINFFKEAYDAVVSFNFSKGSATIRLNNIAWVLDKQTQTSQLIDSYSEEDLSLLYPVLFENGTVYVSLTDFCSAYDKFVSIYEDNMAIISDQELIIDDTQLLSQLQLQINNLPCVINTENLQNLLGSNTYGLPTLDNFMNNDKEIQPNTAESIFKTNAADGYAVSDNYLYVWDNNVVKILSTEQQEPIAELTVSVLPEKIDFYNNKLIIMGTTKHSENSLNVSDSSVLIYDITDKTQPQLLNEFQTCGDIKDYVVKNDNLVFISKIDVSDLTKDKDYYPPYYYNDGNYTEISMEDIRYMPDMQDKAYTSVFALNLNTAETTGYTVLGAGDNIYIDDNGKYFYITAKKSVTSFNNVTINDTILYAYGINEDISFYKKAYVSGFMNIPNIFSFNNHIIAVTKDSQNKSIVSVLDNNLECVNQLNSITLNTFAVDFVDEHIYLQDKSKNIVSVNINDVNNCQQSDISNIAVNKTLYPYKESYFISVEDDVISILDLTDLNDAKTLSSIDVNGTVNGDKFFVMKNGISAEINTVNETSAETETAAEAVAETNIDAENNTVPVQAFYNINDNFEFSFAGNIAENINSPTKVNDKYVAFYADKIVIYDANLAQVFEFAK